jgi:hypothetical protein
MKKRIVRVLLDDRTHVEVDASQQWFAVQYFAGLWKTKSVFSDMNKAEEYRRKMETRGFLNNRIILVQ